MDRTSRYPSGSAIVTPHWSQYGLRAATPGTACVDQPLDHVLVDPTAEVQDQQVLLGGRGGRHVIGVVDQLEMPGGTRPAHHHQRMIAVG